MVGKRKIILLACAGLLTACGFLDGSKEDNREDDFYSYYEEGDIVRIPLVEPYTVYSADNGENWIFDVPFGDFLEGLQVTDIRSLYVEKEQIFLYSHSIDLPGERAPAWFVFDTKNKTSKYYTDQELFVKEYPSGEKMELISRVFERFKKDRKLPWR